MQVIKQNTERKLLKMRIENVYKCCMVFIKWMQTQLSQNKNYKQNCWSLSWKHIWENKNASKSNDKKITEYYPTWMRTYGKPQNPTAP